jgi:hypothetical protein
MQLRLDGDFPDADDTEKRLDVRFVQLLAQSRRQRLIFVERPQQNMSIGQ